MKTIAEQIADLTYDLALADGFTIYKKGVVRFEEEEKEWYPVAWHFDYPPSTKRTMDEEPIYLIDVVHKAVHAIL